MVPPPPSSEDLARAQSLRESFSKIKTQVSQVIVGQDATIEQLLIAMLAGGHCLLEGVPGLAKTLMVRSLAQAMDLDFH
ncbi:MAG: AAA family ATPase, partial [Pirellula sp.]